MTTAHRVCEADPEGGTRSAADLRDRRAVVATDGAPRAIGPYCQAVRVGNLVFTSGQIGIDPHSGTLVPGGIGSETRQVLANLSAILVAAGSSWQRAAKTTVFLVDMGDFEAMNQAYGAFFSGLDAPARATVAVAGLPKGARVEIDVVAVAVD
jgi:2-iminobutanoate/2-iminopropanoate deaminase